MYKPIVLAILDGWGVSNNTQGNAIAKANIPGIDKLKKYYPMTTLQASGISVGIPWGDPGNSEVGHMALGMGKIIYQNLPRITLSIQDQTFFKNEALLRAMRNTKENNSSLHLLGLIGEGAIHSHMDHLFALLKMAQENEVRKVFIHAFTDGRDSSPTSGINILKQIQERTQKMGVGKIATLCGRNWAMDRNNNWDRIAKAYFMLTEGKGELIEDPFKYLEDSYAKNITDEYIEPGVVSENGTPLTTIKDNDSVIFFNFREDRARQLTKAFSVPDFNKIPGAKNMKLEFVTLTSYEKDFPVLVAFPPEVLKDGLGEILSKNGKKQMRISETEKYAHVTYFFNGGKEDPWPEEERMLVPSKIVSKFEEAPEMRAKEITEKTIHAIELEKFDFILINYANPDMIGHTGNEEAAIRAIEAVDTQLTRLIITTLNAGGCLLITADHGNAEEMINLNTGKINTEHSTNPVPLWLVTPNNHKKERSSDEIFRLENTVGGILSDISPTILELMDIKPPENMGGESLLETLK